MQTFLTYPLFDESAAVLDDKRLGNQRRECLTLINAVTVGNGWSRHPAARMWVGYVGALQLYHAAVCAEWRRRGYRQGYAPDVPSRAPMPPWLGRVDLHRSHRSNLLRKLPEWYDQFGWDVPTDLSYVWPV